jgi:hypothetical protein
MQVTFSGTTALCSPARLPKVTEFLSDVNAVLEMCQFGDVAPPPQIPPALMYRPPVQLVKVLASEIGGQLQAIVDEQRVPSGEVMSSFIAQGFDFATDHTVYRDDADLSASLWTFLATSRPRVRMPTPALPASDILCSFFVMSPKHTPAITKPVLQQWIITLGTTTLLQLADSLLCPLCRITNESADTHRIPRIFQSNDDTFFDYEGGFNVPLSEVIKHTNICCQLCSEGGCAHPILCGLVVAVHADSSDGFPVEIGGKGATPPYCGACHVRPGPLCVRQADTHLFFCPECFCREDFPVTANVLDLSSDFFIVK